MRVASVASLACAALALGCAEKKERAPATCVGDCGLSPGLGTGLPTNMEGGGGSNGEGGASNGATSGVDLAGNVRILNDDLDLDTSALMTGAVDLKAENIDGKTVTGLWNGSDPFTLKDLPSSGGIWVLGTPEMAVADDALPAVNAVRTNNADATGTVSMSFYLAHATSIDHAFQLATVPITRDPAKAQVILRLVDKTANANPIAGITATVPSAAAVLYAASNGFSDAVTTTDNTGTVVLANVPAAAWPGALVTVQLTGAKTAGAQIHAVTGAVSIASLVL